MSNYNHHSHNHQVINDQNFMKKIDFLDGVIRKRTLPPEEILNLLPMQKKSCVLDAGAGSGYLTIPAAKRTEETVYALDMDFTNAKYNWFKSKIRGYHKHSIDTRRG